MISPTMRAPHSRWVRARKIGAALAALGFFGTIAVAPMTVPNAFAIPSAGLGITEKSTQQYSSASGADPAIDLGASKPEELAPVQAPIGTAASGPVGALFSLEEFLFKGVVNWGGNKFTFYSQQVLPGGGLEVPGRHVNAAGYVSDADGYIVLAGSAAKGTVYDTPFGYQGKIYDRGTVGNHLDVYIR